MSAGLTTVQTVAVADELRVATSRLFEVFGAWASEADRSDIAVSLATASRHMGWHTDDLAALVPSAEGLDPEPDDAAPADPAGGPTPEPGPLDAALDAIRAAPGSVARLAIAHRVLLPRLAAGCVTVERASAHHTDAPLARVVGFVLSDARRDRDEGELLLERLITDTDTVEQVGAATVDAERRLVAAGGLLPVTLAL